MLRDKFTVINIRMYLDGSDRRQSEQQLQMILSDFSCPRNPDVEHFLKDNAIEFTKKSQSVTYLVFETQSTMLVGYFTIAVKPLVVCGESVSNTVKKKLLRISERNKMTETYTMAAYLIAQLGKNYADGVEGSLTGEELLEAAWSKIREAQYLVGGVVAFLEAENKEKLLSFYRTNCFRSFDTRQLPKNECESRELVKLLRLL